jgi:hypothetical protein
MAQWKSRPFDNWPGAFDNALGLLRSASDLWARRGFDALCVERVLAVLLHALIYPHSREVSSMSVERCIERVGLLENLCAAELRRDAQARGEAARIELIQIMTIAARDWSCGGDPESPPTAEVLRELALRMHRRGLIRRGPPRRVDET